jgi:hypothetical protein
MPQLQPKDIDSLLGLLRQLPNIVQPPTRAALLFGLPPAVANNVRLGGSVNDDLPQIVSVAGAAQLAGEWPILILIRTAAGMVPGTELADQFGALQTLLEARALAEAQPLSASRLANVQIVQLRDALAPLGEASVDAIITRAGRAVNIPRHLDLAQRVLLLIDRANEEGWIGQLLQAAHDVHPEPTVAALLGSVAGAGLPPPAPGAMAGPVAAAAPAPDPHNIWMLPAGKWMVDRKELRKTLLDEFGSENGKRIVIVQGPRYSGKTHSRAFVTWLRHHGQCWPVVIDFEDLARDASPTVESVLELIAEEVGLTLDVRSEKVDAWARLQVGKVAQTLNARQSHCWLIFDHIDKPPIGRDMQMLIRRLAAASVEKTPYLCMLLLGTHAELKELYDDLGDNAATEQLTQVADTDLIEFFSQLYAEQQRAHNLAYDEQSIVRSVAQVLQAGQDQPSPEERFRLQWEALNREIRSVRQRTSGAGGGQ